MEKEKVKQFIKEHKIELILGAISIVSLLFAFRAYRKLDQVDELIKKGTKQLEATFYALKKINPVIRLEYIPEIGFWRSALTRQGIETVGDLIREVRINEGTEFLREFPGIGDEGYYAICTFLKNNATKTFRKLYL